MRVRRQAGGNAHTIKSVNEWGEQAEEQVLWRWQIWLLSTSAFLNTRSYRPSSLEERSFLFSFLLLPPFPLSLALISAQPFLQAHLSSSHLSLYISLAHFPVFFPPRSLCCVIFTLTPLFASLSPSFLFFFFYSQWNSPFSMKTKLLPASHAG